MNLTTQEVVDRLKHEHVDGADMFCAIAPAWKESAPRKPETRAALIVSDLLLRDDGSLVLLDRWPSDEALIISQYHHAGAYKLVPWTTYVSDLRASVKSGVRPPWLPAKPGAAS